MRIRLAEPVRLYVREGTRLVFRLYIDTDSLFDIGEPVMMTCDHHDQLMAPLEYKGVTHYLLVKELSEDQQQALRSAKAA